MSKRRNKNRAPRVLCPICCESGPNKKAAMMIEVITVKSSHHPLIFRAGKAEIDFGFIFDQDTRRKVYILKCPSCKFSQQYSDPILLIEELTPLLSDMFIGEQEKTIIKTKPQKEKEVLPKIVKISEDVNQYTN